ncbi:hypothetical protein FMM68_00500 [Lachnospiraceae bacterium MD329]|nr:hypothetical protein [Lachnospiraceae bacterium MD329]
MDRDRRDIKLVTDEKIAETSSKGNQEKWFDAETNQWYKLDQFGYEALSETIISILLEKSNIEKDTPFTFVRYEPVRVVVHNRERTGCVSDNFLKEGQSVITINHLLSRVLGCSLKDKLLSLTSDKKRIAYLAEATKDYTGLDYFGEYLTLLFEIDSLFLNDDRHLNNIAVIKSGGKYDYCPIFDNGAGLISDTRLSPMDIEPKALISSLRARPFNMSFTRQMNTARALYGKQLSMPALKRDDIMEHLMPILEFYPQRDRRIIADRVVECILTKHRFL